jgi:hypothetical protein
MLLQAATQEMANNSIKWPTPIIKRALLNDFSSSSYVIGVNDQGG